MGVGSGSIGEAVLACGPRVGFRNVVSIGAETTRDAADWVAFHAADDDTRAIGLFLESVRRPAAFRVALERAAEAVLPLDRVGTLRFVSAPHHGSRTSSTPAFIHRWLPLVAFVSAGRGNSFGHPSSDVLARYSDRGVDVAGLQPSQGRTFRWVGQYGYDLNVAKTRDTQLNVFADFSPRLSEAQRRADQVVQTLDLVGATRRRQRNLEAGGAAGRVEPDQIGALPGQQGVAPGHQNRTLRQREQLAAAALVTLVYLRCA